MRSFMSDDNPAATLLIALTVLVIVSCLPVGEWSGGRFKDFNLFEDVFEPTDRPDASSHANVEIDPELQAILAENQPDQEVTSAEELPVRTLDDSNVQPSVETESQPMPAEQAPRVGDMTVIEDYTALGQGPARLRAALAQSGSRTVRIAVIGDSYIEGDIFTQDLRSLMQQRFGGRGTGYVAMHSDFPGFRRSVTQSGKGWKRHDMRHRQSDPVKPLAGEYFVAEEGAVSTYKGTKRIECAQAWSCSRLMYIAPDGGKVTLKNDGGIQEVELAPSETVSLAELDGETSTFAVNNITPGVKCLGVWLDDATGVSVDCMSLRGNSGVAARNLSVELASAMAQFVDYDMIIVEYGMNALSDEQTDYTSYGRVMDRVIARLRECYPDADILLAGVGDRGHKKGSDVVSMSTVGAMTRAQRDCARRSKILFWDIRDAMGGENSIAEWQRNGLVNSDYIHLNHKGGKKLADSFYKSLIYALYGE